MLNEYSISIVIERAIKLQEITLIDIQILLNRKYATKMFSLIFESPSIQTGLKKLVLLKNPNIENYIFDREMI